MQTNLTEHFEQLHAMKPAPLNPAYNPAAIIASRQAVTQMEISGFYDSHTREECAEEYKRLTTYFMGAK